MKKIFLVNGNQKKAGVVILISDKIDFKIQAVTRDKEGHYIMIKASIQEEDIKDTYNIISKCVGYQVNTLYTLNLHNVICQLHLIKLERGRKRNT